MPRVRKLDRPSRLRMILRRQRRLVRPMLLAVPLLALGGFGLLAARGAVEAHGAGSWVRHVLGLAVPLRTVVVDGGRLTTDQDVRDALDIRIGEPIMSVSIADAERRVETLPFVETATVQRRLPGTLVVHLTERRPFAVWQNQGRFVLIDRTGKVVEGQGLNGKDAQAFARLPLVVGEGAPAAAGRLIDALDTAPALRDQVVAMVRVGARRWNLQTRSGCEIMLPEGEEVPAIARLATLEGDHKLLERPLVAIDMRLPDRLMLRPRHVEPPPADTAPTDPHAADAAHPAGTASSDTPRKPA